MKRYLRLWGFGIALLIFCAAVLAVTYRIRHDREAAQYYLSALRTAGINMDQRAGVPPFRYWRQRTHASSHAARRSLTFPAQTRSHFATQSARLPTFRQNLFSRKRTPKMPPWSVRSTRSTFCVLWRTLRRGDSLLFPPEQRLTGCGIKYFFETRSGPEGPTCPVLKNLSPA